MGDGQKYCMKWNDFSSNIVSALGTLREEETFVDVTIACAGQTIKAHKVILSACSLYFQRVLRENPCQHPIVILRDIALWEFEALLSFMYHGHVMVEEEQISQLLKTAELLEIRGLATENEKRAVPLRRSSTQSYQSSPSPPAKKCRPIPMLQSIPMIHSTPILQSTDNTALPIWQSNTRTSGNINRSNSLNENTDSLVWPGNTDIDIKDEFDDTLDDESDGEMTGSDNNSPDDSDMYTLRQKQMTGFDTIQPNLNDLTTETISDGSRKLAFHEPRPCPICKRVYRDAATLRTHAAIMHTETDDPFFCNCGASFLTKFDMYIHRKNGHK